MEKCVEAGAKGVVRRQALPEFDHGDDDGGLAVNFRAGLVHVPGLEKIRKRDQAVGVGAGQVHEAARDSAGVFEVAPVNELAHESAAVAGPEGAGPTLRNRGGVQETQRIFPARIGNVIQTKNGLQGFVDLFREQVSGLGSKEKNCAGFIGGQVWRGGERRVAGG